jgi:protein SCO1/2
MKLLLTSLLCLTIFSTQAERLSESSLKKIQFEQKINTQVSLDLPFIDEGGQHVQFASFCSTKPVILVCVYYRCPMLCTLVLNGLVDGLQQITKSAGKDFEVVCVSIDSTETPDLAAAKKNTYLKLYGRHDTDNGWHFLTGREQEIRTLTNEVGFRFDYDTVAKQYAHPSGIIILSPSGKITRYLFGITFSATDLNNSLKQAAIGNVSSPIQQFVLLCFNYRPFVGKYSLVIMSGVRMTALLTIIMLGLFVTRWVRRTKHPPEIGRKQ